MVTAELHRLRLNYTETTRAHNFFIKLRFHVVENTFPDPGEQRKCRFRCEKVGDHHGLLLMHSDGITRFTPLVQHSILPEIHVGFRIEVLFIPGGWG